MHGKYYCPKCLHVFEFAGKGSSIGCPRCGVSVDTRKYKVDFDGHNNTTGADSPSGFTRRLIAAGLIICILTGVIFLLTQFRE
jgi:hypothetical protein